MTFEAIKQFLVLFGTCSVILGLVLVIVAPVIHWIGNRWIFSIITSEVVCASGIQLLIIGVLINLCVMLIELLM